MKALDILATPISDIKVPQFMLLTGEDTVLKRIVTQRIQAATPRNDTEVYETKFLEQMANMIAEGSVFGSRFVIIDFIGKWGRTQSLERAILAVRETEDSFVIRAEEGPSSEGTSHLWSVVDCKKLGNKKSREKFINLLLPIHGVKAYEDAVKKMAERVEDSSQVESAILTLSLAIPDNHTITQTDIGKVLKELSARKDLSRALIRKNLPRLAREIREGESPQYVLTILHNTLLRIFSWLEMTQIQSEEEKVAEILKIPPRFIKEWRQLKTFYSSKAVREVMEATADAFDAANSGHPWMERLQQALKKLN